MLLVLIITQFLLDMVFEKLPTVPYLYDLMMFKFRIALHFFCLPTKLFSASVAGRDIHYVYHNGESKMYDIK